MSLRFDIIRVSRPHPSLSVDYRASKPVIINAYLGRCQADRQIDTRSAQVGRMDRPKLAAIRTKLGTSQTVGVELDEGEDTIEDLAGEVDMSVKFLGDW